MMITLRSSLQWLDRHQSMQHQQKGYAGLYGDGSPAEGSHGHTNRGDSPGGHQSPRYHNKGPYLERNKEKRGQYNWRVKEKEEVADAIVSKVDGL